MRAFAISGFAALAISLMAPASVWAWSTEQATSNGAAAALAEQEDPLKALQDKVDSKNSSKQSGFYFSAGPAQQPLSPYGFGSNSSAPPVSAATPGFRDQLR